VFPASAGAVIAFLLLVAPGVAFELTRKRRRPDRADSTFVEVARILLAGTCISLISLSLLAIAGLAGDGLFVAVGRAIRHPAVYSAGHPERLLLTAAAYLVVAVTAAVLAGDAHGYGRRQSQIVPVSAWFLMLDQYTPSGTDVHVSVQMLDGTVYIGPKTTFTPDQALGDRELVLRSPLHSRAPGAQKALPLGDDWHRLILPAPQISSIAVSYVTKEGWVEKPRGKFGLLVDKAVKLWRSWGWWQVSAVALLAELALLAVLSWLLPGQSPVGISHLKGPPSVPAPEWLPRFDPCQPPQAPSPRLNQSHWCGPTFKDPSSVTPPPRFSHPGRR